MSLEVTSLYKAFKVEKNLFDKGNKKVYAVNNVSFNVKEGETFGIVGESGSGKTTTARIIVGMYKSDSGSIKYDGQELTHLNRSELKGYREKVRYVFQDPARSLNPRMKILDILTEGLRYSSLWKGKEDAYYKAKSILEEVGLKESDLFRHPGEFSGGQRQRISIARSLMVDPSLLICDEVVSALDVSIQGQVLNLLVDLKKSRGLSYIFITHDLKVACYFCDRIAVMYKGEILEIGDARTLYKEGVNPYTRNLFNIK